MTVRSSPAAFCRFFRLWAPLRRLTVSGCATRFCCLIDHGARLSVLTLPCLPCAPKTFRDSDCRLAKWIRVSSLNENLNPALFTESRRSSAGYRCVNGTEIPSAAGGAREGMKRVAVGKRTGRTRTGREKLAEFSTQASDSMTRQRRLTKPRWNMADFGSTFEKRRV